MVTINIGSSPQDIPLGRRGENEATQIVFDLTDLISVYGEGSAVLLAKRSQDESAYPVAAVRDGDTLTWTVTDADTAYRGRGECELFWYVGEALAKSVIYSTSVNRDIGETIDDPPDPYETWLETLTGLAAETEQNAQDAAQSASEAEADAEEIRNMTATAETLAPGSAATASYENGVLTLGIPRGDTGEQGPQGIQGPQGPKGDTTYYTFSDPSSDGNIIIEVT